MEDLDNNRDYLERPSVELKSPSSPHTGSTNSLCSSNRDSPTAPPHQEERDELLLCTRQHGPSLDLDDEIFGCEPHRSSWQDSWQDDPKHNQKGEIPCASSFEPGSDILLPQRRDDHERCLKGSSLPSSISPPPRYKSERQVYVNARTGENSALTGTQLSTAVVTLIHPLLCAATLVILLFWIFFSTTIFLVSLRKVLCVRGQNRQYLGSRFKCTCAL